MSKTIEELYRERDKRVKDAINLEIPDMVPVEMALDYFPARAAGLGCDVAFYDYDAWVKAYEDAIYYLQPDAIFWLPAFVPGKALEYLNPTHFKWPGGLGVPSDHSHQFVEGEWMKANEYEAFLSDHGDYILRIHLSRVLGGLESFNRLPGLSSIGYGYFGGLALAEAVAEPDVNQALENLINAGKEIRKYRGKSEEFYDRVTANGVVVNMGGMAQAPFDIVSDFLRGMHGTMMDMFRQPDKLLEAVDFICRDTIERTIPMMAGLSNPRLFMPLHRGSDGFMSLKDFERFYWPSLKTVIFKAVEVGMIPSVFFEGVWNDRLEYMLELPKGKVVCHFDATDLFKAKDVLKGHLCIKGNVPASILQTGSITDVQAYCKQLIDVVGKDGGYIMCNRSALDEAKMENLKAMIDFTHEYGIYA